MLTRITDELLFVISTFLRPREIIGTVLNVSALVRSQWREIVRFALKTGMMASQTENVMFSLYSGEPLPSECHSDDRKAFCAAVLCVQRTNLKSLHLLFDSMPPDMAIRLKRMNDNKCGTIADHAALALHPQLILSYLRDPKNWNGVPFEWSQCVTQYAIRKRLPGLLRWLLTPNNRSGGRCYLTPTAMFDAFHSLNLEIIRIVYYFWRRVLRRNSLFSPPRLHQLIEVVTAGRIDILEWMHHENLIPHINQSTLRRIVCDRPTIQSIIWLGSKKYQWAVDFLQSIIVNPQRLAMLSRLLFDETAGEMPSDRQLPRADRRD